MLKVKEGQINQAAILFDRHHTSVFNYFMKSNRNRMLADDLTQNVFEKVIKYRGSYHDSRNFKAWLFTIARNVRTDEYRKNSNFNTSCDEIEIVNPNANAHELMEKEENQNLLLSALDRLKDDEKELIILTKLERLKFSEVSKIMGITENALKVKSHRCMKKLRSILINEINYEY